jgi:hypothetical protein
MDRAESSLCLDALCRVPDYYNQQSDVCRPGEAAEVA